MVDMENKINDIVEGILFGMLFLGFLGGISLTIYIFLTEF